MVEEPEALEVLELQRDPEELEEEDQPEAPRFSAGTREEVHGENRGRLNCFATVTQDLTMVGGGLFLSLSRASFLWSALGMKGRWAPLQST